MSRALGKTLASVVKPGQVCLCVMDEQSPWLLRYRERYRDRDTHDSEQPFPVHSGAPRGLQILNLSDPTKHIAINIDSPNTEYQAEGLTVTNVKISAKCSDMLLGIQ